MRRIKMHGRQKLHCCGRDGYHPIRDDQGEWTITARDGGGGAYPVLTTLDWSFNSVKEFDKWAARVREAVEHICRMESV